MQHRVVVGAVLAILAASSGLQAQDGNWVETRFHRVHLLNGNFIDGNLIGESDRTLVMKVGGGEMQIRKDMIERTAKGSLRVEYVKMRSYKEAPKLETVRAQKSASGSAETPKTPEPPKPPPSAPTESVTLSGTKDDQLAQAADILKNGTPARKRGAIEALKSVGAEAATFLASQMVTFEDDLLPFAGSVLLDIKEKSVLPIIKPLAKSDRARLREQAITLVGILGTAREDADSVRGQLADQDLGVRGAAITALERMADADSFDTIADSLTDPDPAIRAKVLSALNTISQANGLSEKLATTLTRAIEQSQGNARIDLLKDASNLGSKDLGPVMSKLAMDQDPMVRSYAIMALGKMAGGDYGGFILERMSIERDFGPRIQLAGACQNMRLNTSVDALIEWMGDEDKEIRAASLRALRALTGQNLPSEKAAWEEWRKASKQ